MNAHILENAAIYANAYRSNFERKGMTVDKVTLRGHITRLFGATYAAVLVQ
jgi:hypothetical protein